MMRVIPSIGTIMDVIRKWLLFPRTFILQTRTNQNTSSCTNIYRRIVPRARTNQNKASSKKLYRRTIPRTWTNYVQQGEEQSETNTITEQKDAGNEVTYDVPNFNALNVFEWGKNNPDVSYKRVYMANSGNEYFTEMLDPLNEYNDCHGQILSSKNIK